MGLDSRIFNVLYRMTGMRGTHRTNKEAIQGAKEGERHHHVLDMGMASRNFKGWKRITGMRWMHTRRTRYYQR